VEEYAALGKNVVRGRLKGVPTMPGTEYECGECRHRFRTPEGVAPDARTLMCPACGSIDLNVMQAVRPRPAVLRAREGAPAGDLRPPRKTDAA